MKKYFYLLANDKINGFIPGIVKFTMLILSFVYQGALYILKILYCCKILKQERLGVKVISVGNLTLGGTGKTPLEELIADYLLLRGKDVVVLTRGYKALDTVSGLSGDEAMILKNNLGVVVIEGKNRVINAKRALNKYHCDTILLDDAFQHWRLFRDLDIITIDATNPFGNSFLIPRGILRESKKAIKRADLVVFTKTDRCGNIDALVKEISVINKKVAFVYSRHQALDFVNLINGSRLHYLDFSKVEDICFVCGIADPSYFKHTLTDIGLNVGLSFVFPDHYRYTKDEFVKIVNECKRKGIKNIILTQKDAVKLGFLKDLKESIGLDFWFLRIKMKLTKNEDELFNKLDNLYIG
ncbi:MAG: tetraacyldisaccharide 4'-kinase [Candidatus Gygaella obscura]|nr:tetraacyldisaccharide 4'-kinase [Candidatus Gygaella obscura]